MTLSFRDLVLVLSIRISVNQPDHQAGMHAHIVILVKSVVRHGYHIVYYAGAYFHARLLPARQYVEL